MKNSMILIDIEPYMAGVSLIENGKLKEHYVEQSDFSYITGNIYKGRVENVLNGLQSAFVNFGSARNGFLSALEVPVHKTVLSDSGAIPQKLDVETGGYVMVQATKEETSSKGACLTATISLAGRYVIFLPTLGYSGVSSKITDESERKRLLKVVEKLAPKGSGFIARTACIGATKAEITEESNRLIDRWHKILLDFENKDGVGQLYSDGDFVFRSVRDMLSHDVGSIVCNDKNVAKNLTALMRERNLPYKDEVRFYEGAYDIYDAFNILSEVDKLLDKRVKLQNGVELVIEQTEALTVIDVNTAQFAKGDNHEETVFRANLEATGEIARQIRLRNVGGIIIVDFIDMVDESHKIAVVEELKRHFVFDRTKTRVASMTSLGLVEITRKKIGKELSSLLLADCPYCDGEAKSYNVDYVARKIKAELKQIFAKQKDASNVLITVNTVLFDELLRGNRFSIDCETIWSDKRIYVAPQKDILNCNFKIKIVGGAMIDVPNSARLLR